MEGILKTSAPEKEEMSAEELERELSEKVGIPVDYKTVTLKNILKFLIFSGIGV